MILLLGKNNLVEKYAKEILNADIDNDMVYYPDEKTHYSELPQWVEIARKEQPYIVTTQNIEILKLLQSIMLTENFYQELLRKKKLYV